MSSIPERQKQETSIEMFSALRQLWKGRLWVVLFMLAFAGAFATAAYTMTPIYRVATILVPAGQERAGLGGMLSSALGSFGGLASLAGISAGSSSTGTDEALAVLRSRQFIGQFIADRQLLPLLYAEKWDPNANHWRVPSGNEPTVGQAVKYFTRDILNLTQDKKTNLITLQIEWKDRVLAAEWANDLVRRINAVMRARSLANADASLAYLRKELDLASVVETRVAISRLVEAQVNQRMISSVTDEFSFRVVDRAIAPDQGDTARPNKPLMIIFGLFTGIVLGSAFVIFRGLLRYSAGRDS